MDLKRCQFRPPSLPLCGGHSQKSVESCHQVKSACNTEAQHQLRMKYDLLDCRQERSIFHQRRQYFCLEAPGQCLACHTIVWSLLSCSISRESSELLYLIRRTGHHQVEGGKHDLVRPELLLTAHCKLTKSLILLYEVLSPLHSYSSCSVEMKSHHFLPAVFVSERCGWAVGAPSSHELSHLMLMISLTAPDIQHGRQ